MRRIRGFADLVFDLVEETTNLVERTHDAVVERSVRRFAPIEPAKSVADAVTGVQLAISSVAFESVRLVNGVTRHSVSAVADAAEVAAGARSEMEGLATPVESNAAGSASWVIDHLQSSLNGFWGDYFAQKHSALDLGMTVRHQGRELPLTREAFAASFPQPTRKLVVLVHGLASTEWFWSLRSEEYYGKPGVTFGTRLLEDLDFTPVYLRYNSGRHISDNGRALAELLNEVLDAYPIEVDEIALIGHSMGGLVARSAAHYARKHDESWIDKLRHVACIGSPHLGAPAEKSMHVLARVLERVDAAGAQVPAELLETRSVGVKDLRHGYILEEEWLGQDPNRVFDDTRLVVPLVDGVGYYFLAATISDDPEHPVARLLGDLLVRVPSATGRAPEPARSVHFTSAAVLPGMNHLHIANHPEVYRVLNEFLAGS